MSRLQNAALPDATPHSIGTEHFSCLAALSAQGNTFQVFHLCARLARRENRFCHAYANFEIGSSLLRQRALGLPSLPRLDLFESESRGVSLPIARIFIRVIKLFRKYIFWVHHAGRVGKTINAGNAHVSATRPEGGLFDYFGSEFHCRFLSLFRPIALGRSSQPDLPELATAGLTFTGREK